MDTPPPRRAPIAGNRRATTGERIVARKRSDAKMKPDARTWYMSVMRNHAFYTVVAALAASSPVFSASAEDSGAGSAGKVESGTFSGQGGAAHQPPPVPTWSFGFGFFYRSDTQQADFERNAYGHRLHSCEYRRNHKYCAPANLRVANRNECEVESQQSKHP